MRARRAPVPTLSALALAMLLAVGALLGSAAPASAGGPTSLTLTVAGGQPVRVTSADHPQLFDDLSQIVYRLGFENGPNAGHPLPAPPAVPGNGVVMVINYHDVPTYRYQLYPHAVGGPRLYLPAEQLRPELDAPGRTGWYASDARMVDALRAAGALPPQTPVPASAASVASPAAAAPALAGRAAGGDGSAAGWWPPVPAVASLGLLLVVIGWLVRPRRQKIVDPAG